MPIGGLDCGELRCDVWSRLSLAGFSEALTDPLRGRDSFTARGLLDLQEFIVVHQDLKALHAMRVGDSSA